MHSSDLTQVWKVLRGSGQTPGFHAVLLSSPWLPTLLLLAFPRSYDSQWSEEKGVSLVCCCRHLSALCHSLWAAHAFTSLNAFQLLTTASACSTWIFVNLGRCLFFSWDNLPFYLGSLKITHACSSWSCSGLSPCPLEEHLSIPQIHLALEKAPGSLFPAGTAIAFPHSRGWKSALLRSLFLMLFSGSTASVSPAETDKQGGKS